VKEIVAVVGIAHNDVVATRCGDAPHQGISITLSFDVNDARAESFRDLDRPIGAPIVSNDDFPGDVGSLDGLLCFLNARAHSLRFIQTRHYYGELHFRRVRQWDDKSLNLQFRPERNCHEFDSRKLVLLARVLGASVSDRVVRLECFS
jgi:hypothetical protein